MCSYKEVPVPAYKVQSPTVDAKQNIFIQWFAQNFQRGTLSQLEADILNLRSIGHL